MDSNIDGNVQNSSDVDDGLSNDDGQNILEINESYPKPTNQDYLSFYVVQHDWKPTKPLKPVSAQDPSPGPATVNLPSVLGDKAHDFTRTKAPAYVMGIKHGHGIDDTAAFAGPGPAAYDITGLTNQGKLSKISGVIGRGSLKSGLEYGGAGPGPGAYNPHNGYKLVYPCEPGYSMGHASRSGMNPPYGPGPGSYTLPPTGTGPAFSMGKPGKHGRSGLSTADLEGPGPATYIMPNSNINRPKPPGFYMGLKLPAAHQISTKGPGPGAHSLHLVKYDKYSSPRITFGIKHSMYKALPGFAAEY